MGGGRLATGTLLLGLLAALCSPAAVAKPAAPDPVYVGGHFGDPAVVRAGGRFIAVGTGALTLRLVGKSLRRWKQTAPVLKRLPSWARAGDIWAADLAKVKGRWLLYYSAPVKGLTASGRCIGVAKAKKPTRAFTPVDRAPLVCPPKGRTPPADDPVPGRQGLPRHGVIDPSLAQTPGEDPLLLYKTDGIPSTLRTLQLRPNGLRPRKGAVSREVLRSAGVVENPVVLRRNGNWLLFTSEGSYTGCAYATTWRRATSPEGWADATPQELLDRRTTGLCGPGGADVFASRNKTMIAFHAWACRGGKRPCGKKFHFSQSRQKKAVRALYVARLRFSKGAPYVARYLQKR